MESARATDEEQRRMRLEFLASYTRPQVDPQLDAQRREKWSRREAEEKAARTIVDITVEET